MPQTLPTETIISILSFLPPCAESLQTLCRCGLVSKSFSSLSSLNYAWEPQLRHWTRGVTGIDLSPAPSSQAGNLVATKDSNGKNWRIDEPYSVKPYVRRRTLLDKQAKGILMEMVGAVSGRRELIADLVELGGDVEDEVMRLAKASRDDYPDNWIAVRYWANTSLETLRRISALTCWEPLVKNWKERSDDDSSFDNFDLFLLSTFDSFRKADPVDITEKVEALDPFALCQGRLHPGMSLQEIVKEVWNGMGEAGYLKAISGSHGLLLSEILDSKKTATEDPTAGIRSTDAVAILLSAILRNLPWEWEIVAYPVFLVADNAPLTIQAYRLNNDADLSLREIIYFNLEKGAFVTRDEICVFLKSGNPPIPEEPYPNPLILSPRPSVTLLTSLAREVLSSYFTRVNGHLDFSSACGAVLANAILFSHPKQHLEEVELVMLRSYPFHWDLTALKRFFKDLLHAEDYVTFRDYKDLHATEDEPPSNYFAEVTNVEEYKKKLPMPVGWIFQFGVGESAEAAAIIGFTDVPDTAGNMSPGYLCVNARETFRLPAEPLSSLDKIDGYTLDNKLLDKFLDAPQLGSFFTSLKDPRHFNLSKRLELTYE